MKNVLLYLILSVASGHLWAQAYSYHSLIDTSLRWHTLNIIYPLGHQTDLPGIYSIGADTTIQTLDYKEVTGPSFAIPASIREDSTHRVYLYYMGTDHLIFDFAAAVGDTIRETPADTMPVVVRSIDTIAVDHSLRRVLHIDRDSYPYDEWIEGVGSRYFGPLDHLINQMGTFTFCGITRNDTVVYVPDSGTSCLLTGTPDVPVALWAVYPDPATDFIHITGGDGIPISGYVIFDIDGRIVTHGVYSSAIDVSELAGGSYILCLSSRDDRKQFIRLSVVPRH
ncbi:MAG: T9SS type A sorting domain-containing protein [Bacteroidetes bacterium]|nr:T9SS type A sorting domain-containing protein [Bacteroidota bacterium]